MELKLRAWVLPLVLAASAVATTQHKPTTEKTSNAAPTQAATTRPGVYDAYEFLIGDWDVSIEGAAPTAVTRFSWGPGKSYVWFTTSLITNGTDVPHFEGLLMWNGVQKNLDMLLTLDLHGGRVQERGVVAKQADGTVVRDITTYYSEGTRMADGTLVGPAGASAKFRQTFKPQGANKILTSLMRETPTGWVPTFPGSDKAVMTRRSASR